MCGNRCRPVRADCGGRSGAGDIGGHYDVGVGDGSRGHLRLVRDAHVLAQAVLVLELFAAMLALALRLGRMLCTNMSPQIDRRNDHFTELTL